MNSEETCEYCGETIETYDNGGPVVYSCPSCSRSGCDQCMPAGNGCMCPQCEEGEE